MIKKIILIVVALIGIMWLFARPHRITGDCMEPAVKDGQLIFLNRISPYLRGYKIDDIILFKHNGKIWISRIVALDKDRIHIAEGNILVNGISLQDAVQRNWTDWKYGNYAIDNPLQIPLDHVFVLSDNLSAHHDDSRIFGPISKKSILGLAWKLF